MSVLTVSTLPSCQVYFLLFASEVCQNCIIADITAYLGRTTLNILLKENLKWLNLCTIDADELSCRNDKKNARGKTKPITIYFGNIQKEMDKNEIP